jgi:hypothetical protein
MRIIRWLSLALAFTATEPALSAGPEVKTNCYAHGGGIDPVRVCVTELEDEHSITYSYCGFSSIDGKCRTWTKEKPRTVEPSVEHIPHRGGGATRVLRGGSAIR